MARKQLPIKNLLLATGALVVVAGMSEVESVARTNSGSGDEHHFRVKSRGNSDIRELLIRSTVGEGFGVVGLTPVDMSLEDVFVHLVTEENESQ